MRKLLRELARAEGIDALLRNQPHPGRPRDSAAIAGHLTERRMYIVSDRVLVVEGAQHGR